MNDKQEEHESTILSAWCDIEFELCDELDVLIRAGWDSNTLKRRIIRKMIERDKLIEEFSILMERREKNA